VQRLDVRHAASRARWHVPAIRELAARRDFEPDPAWIARTLVPSIRARRAAQARRVLLGLGLLARDEATGAVRQAEALLTTGPEDRAAFGRARQNARATPPSGTESPPGAPRAET
jgi:hypothetical protein